MYQIGLDTNVKTMSLSILYNCWVSTNSLSIKSLHDHEQLWSPSI